MIRNSMIGAVCVACLLAASMALAQDQSAQEQACRALLEMTDLSRPDDEHNKSISKTDLR